MTIDLVNDIVKGLKGQYNWFKEKELELCCFGPRMRVCVIKLGKASRGKTMREIVDKLRRYVCGGGERRLLIYWVGITAGGSEIQMRWFSKLGQIL